MEYRTAEEVKAIAEDLAWEHHEDLAERGPRVVWLFTRASSKSGKEPTYKIRKITGINAFLATNPLPDKFGFGQQDFVVVEVGHFFWMRMKPGQQKGFVDHMLSHLVYDYEKESWRIEPPQYGEFPEVLERHGDWRPDRSFREWAKAVSEQLSLLPDEPEEPEEREDAGDEDNTQVSVTFGDKTVDTDTNTMRRVSEGLANGEIVIGPNGEKVDKETGEVLEEAPA